MVDRMGRESESAMDIIVRFDIGGGSFQYDAGGKAARILRDIADDLMSMKRGERIERAIHDGEGNRIGSVRVRIPGGPRSG
jgi:hypothetical protein